ncbi:hypothetical protein [Chitinophaga sp. CF418]|uniref:hypothetical protein n=1 Tax=Chitinophaga sp. CF418 TaxID=1855287 RepID=UPI00091688C7|nr:hypothetical protein [Chitinophaga sp. CF418]SHN45958.1 hypothetical protein SAMN05216311_12249 [Chitinophaga sp. CF418]
MTEYQAQDLFNDTQIYDLSDLVKGGANGDANTPLKVLADRTEWLRRRLGRIEVKTITGSYVFDDADLGKGFSFHINGNTSFTLPDVSSLTPGTPIRINTRIPVIKALTILTAGGQKIYDGSDDVTEMYMHDAERLVLIAVAEDNGDTPDHWEIFDAFGNFHAAGQSFGVRLQPRNSFMNDGALKTRADTPRLWAQISKMGAAVVSDTVWNSDPGGQPVYRGCFSTGTSSLNFRLPDERGMHDRYLEMGRNGITSGRLYDNPGGYGPDALKQHNHTSEQISKRGYPDDSADRTNSDYYWISPGNDPGHAQNIVINSAGTSPENNVKTIGKIPVTLY